MGCTRTTQVGILVLAEILLKPTVRGKICPEEALGEAWWWSTEKTPARRSPSAVQDLYIDDWQYSINDTVE